MPLSPKRAGYWCCACKFGAPVVTVVVAGVIVVVVVFTVVVVVVDGTVLPAVAVTPVEAGATVVVVVVIVVVVVAGAVGAVGAVAPVAAICCSHVCSCLQKPSLGLIVLRCCLTNAFACSNVQPLFRISHAMTIAEDRLIPIAQCTRTRWLALALCASSVLQNVATVKMRVRRSACLYLCVHVHVCACTYVCAWCVCGVPAHGLCVCGVCVCNIFILPIKWIASSKNVCMLSRDVSLTPQCLYTNGWVGKGFCNSSATLRTCVMPSFCSCGNVEAF